MKKLLFIVLSAFFCSAMSLPTTKETTYYDDAVEIAVADFLKCKLSKNYNVFSILIDFYTEYAPYEISDNLMTISILPIETMNPQYYITFVDTLGSTRLPTRHIIKDGKLFYWHDPDYGLTEEMVKVFMKFNLAKTLDISDLSILLGQEVHGDEKTKGADYYFCKENFANYKRVVTNIGLGWYKPPKLKCK